MPTTQPDDSRLPDDWWEEGEGGAEECARCGYPLCGEKHTIVELQRVVAMDHCGLALQGMTVHRSCYENRINQARYAVLASSPVALASWKEIMTRMREQVARRDELDGEGEGWKG